MARYKIRSVGMRGHVHLYEEPRPLDNIARVSLSQEFIAPQPTANGSLSVCFRGDRYVVGNPATQTITIFHLIKGTWTLQRQITDTTPGSGFGSTVCISGTLIAVGAPSYDSGAGRVYLYQNVGNGYEACRRPYLELYGEPGANFGASMDLDGTMLVVGAPFATGGSGGTARYGIVLSYLYDISARNWNDHSAVVSAYQQDGSQFGASVSLDKEIALAVGSPKQNINQGSTKLAAGCVQTYTRNGAVWNFGALLVNPKAVAGDALGTSISYRADRLLAGAPGNGVGTALLFVGSFATWQLSYAFTKVDATASAVGKVVDQDASNNLIYLPAPSINRVFVFELTQAGNWLPAAGTTLVGSDTQAGDQFGIIMSASNRSALVGSQRSDGTYNLYKFS